GFPPPPATVSTRSTLDAALSPQRVNSARRARFKAAAVEYRRCYGMEWTPISTTSRLTISACLMVRTVGAGVAPVRVSTPPATVNDASDSAYRPGLIWNGVVASRWLHKNFAFSGSIGTTVGSSGSTISSRTRSISQPGPEPAQPPGVPSARQPHEPGGNGTPAASSAPAGNTCKRGS